MIAEFNMNPSDRHSSFASAQDTRSVPIDKDVAASLVRRSIQFRHDRLAVVRLCMAVHCGAVLDEADWQYCRGVIARDSDAQLRSLLDEASRYACAPAVPARPRC